MIRNKDISELAEILKHYINGMDLTLEGIDGFYLNQFTKRYMLHILARMTHYIGNKVVLTVISPTM